MPLHTLDLVFAPEHDARIRERWEVLREAGLPSQARHRGASNAPHVTVLSGVCLPDEVLRHWDPHRRETTQLVP